MDANDLQSSLARASWFAMVVVMFIVALIPIGRAGGQEKSETSQKLDFNRDIRPILSNHCFQCHGADEESRAADLRLDVRESAVNQGAINPAAPGESHLLSRILATDPEMRMPPSESNKPLSDHQIGLLKRWISEGAEYQDHWAFQRVERPAIPVLDNDHWSRNDIDRFILRKLRQSGLQPSRRADSATLLRRATQDVLGLLPTVDEAKLFFEDSAPDAWERLVDRLLENPHYGERWGRHWLDQARYADSNGYTIDGPRVMWPYRDWVINALNQDMPFDQFTVEQLAGDLLPNATKTQRVASAFHRNTMINEEGGVKPDQFRHEALIDRVNTTGAVWMGLTVGCAQCHSHKFDPITHDEFYRLYAFFNGAADANNAGEQIEVRADEMFGWSEAQFQQLEELQKLRAEKSLLEKNAPDQPNLAALDWQWQQAKVTAVRASGSIILKINPDNSLLVKSEPNANDAYTITLQKPENVDNSAGITAIRLRLMTDASLPGGGPGTASNGNLVLTDFYLKSGVNEYRFARAWADHSQPKYPVVDAIDELSTTGWAINVDDAQKAAGARMNAPHEAIFALSEPVSFTDGIVNVLMRHDLNKNYLTGHFAIEFSTARDSLDSPGSASAVRLAAIRNRIAELESLLPAKGASFKQMVMKDLEKPPETYLLTRGDFLSPDKNHGPLSPGVPASLAQQNASTDFANRLDLAKWLIHRDNPLTARVTVNRVWARYFGRGLVETENDFGYQGTPPTHPELLDWLAAEFIESGWSLKHLHRTILQSATYQQSSEVSTDQKLAMTIDPDNYLLSRQSRFRVEAEIVRDLAVVASGLFSAKIGGPSVYLPQPDGIYDFTQNKKDWPTSTGPDRYRRTMYTMFYRSAPYPLLQTFDAPDFSTVCTRRSRSNTPLQSLTVANDKVFTELAEGLARRTLKSSELTTDQDRCRQMFRTCLTREPVEQEAALLEDFLSRELSRFVSAPEEAAKFVIRTDDDPPVETLAAWTSVARALFNTDEFLMRN